MQQLPVLLALCIGMCRRPRVLQTVGHAVPQTAVRAPALQTVSSAAPQAHAAESRPRQQVPRLIALSFGLCRRPRVLQTVGHAVPQTVVRARCRLSATLRCRPPAARAADSGRRQQVSRPLDLSTGV